MGRKILGFILIIVAIILTLGIVGQLRELITVIINFLAIFRGKLNGEQVGYALGQMMIWILHFALTILAWKYGVRFIKNISN